MCCVSISADSPPPSFQSQNRSNGASHMGPRGPPVPPGSGIAATGAGQPRLGQTSGGTGGSSGGGGTGGGQEPTPMDMSIGPQPNQPMTTSHGTAKLRFRLCCCRRHSLTSFRSSLSTTSDSELQKSRPKRMGPSVLSKNFRGPLCETK